MHTVTLSKSHRVVIPSEVRERLGLEPGARLTLIQKGGLVYLVPERPLPELRGVARGVGARGLREKGASR